MKLKTVLFTDTHFGVKNNSIIWLDSQENFINKQLIPTISRLHEQGYHVRVIHLGDVFDSRSTISTLVATRVSAIFQRIAWASDEFYIIGGNHDYYSPNTNSIDTLNLIFRDINNITLVTKEPLQLGRDLLVDWYSWLDQETLKEYIQAHNIHRVFTHADIVSSPVNIHGVEIFSGHIHTPFLNMNLKNLGSCYALSFADCNSQRGFYVIDEETHNMTFIENESSIKFWRFYNEDLLELPDNMGKDDYIEIYATPENLTNPQIIEVIKELTDKYKNIWSIPQSGTVNESSDVQFEGYDIETIARDSVPENLQIKFERILRELSE